MAKNQHRLTCSFCGRPREEVNILIAGQNGDNICDDCVEHAQNIIAEENNNREQARRSNEKFANSPPLGDQIFFGSICNRQADAKKILSVAVYNHYKRITQKGQLMKLKLKKAIS